MDTDLKQRFNDLSSKEDELRFDALKTIIKITDEPVDWVYEVWDELIQKLEDENSFHRSIAIMVLCNLAKSDRENRMSLLIDRLLMHTRDEKFITSRQCIQAIWKIAAANRELKTKVVDHLEKQYQDCTGEKHYNLIRQDIIQSIKNLIEADNDEALPEKIKKLLQSESNLNYRKKYEQILKSHA